MKKNTYSINDYLLAAMRNYHIPVVGYAIIDNYQIVSVDTVSIDSNISPTRDSLFQAASLSKSITAYGLLKLIAQQKIDLNISVDSQLTSWHIPSNDFSKNHPVLLRQILSMTSGLCYGLSTINVPSYKQDEPLPTLIQILEGEPPAKNSPVKLFYQPGSRYFYSGGGYQVIQQLIEDKSGKPFNEEMKELVLTPLKMDHSIFQYPLDEREHKKVIPGFDVSGEKCFAGWNNIASSASGGLWSTPTDLAKFAINVSQTYLGKPHAFLPENLSKEMLTRQSNSSFGLGVVVNGYRENLNFRKNGHNTGYHNELLMFPNTGQGIVIMTNSPNGISIINYIVPIIAHRYHWPCYFPDFDESIVIPEFV